MKILDYSAVVSCSAVLFLAAANLEVQQEDNHYFEIRDEAGVPTAVTTGGPRFTGELFSFELVLTLAQDPAEIESLISSATGFAMTGDGLFVVVDNKWAGGGYSVARLVLFGPDGRYLRSMGRVGEGPGEFQGMLHGCPVELHPHFSN